tara:strand:+ start:435 stop:1277 length:843 start_codon:yes stop_codon:yes gene_type:complete
MKYNLSIIISHYCPNKSKNPLFKTIDSIKNQVSNNNIEIIIADDGSKYSEKITNEHSKKFIIPNDKRCFYILKEDRLNFFLDENNINNKLIKKWIYLPKKVQCMSKARVLNEAVKFAESKYLLFLDDDNYLMKDNSIKSILTLFKKYDFIVGQIQDKNGNLRSYNSSRVQGTTIAIKTKIFNKIKGFGNWTEEYSCGVDSDFWIKVFNYFQKNNQLKACYVDTIITCDSYSKRWKKYTKFFKEIRLKYKFYKLYNCKNYKSPRYNLSRNKKIWIENLINE